MMFKAKKKEVAEQIAKEHNLLYGFSVLDGRWYVGTKEELAKCGAAPVIKATDKSA